MILVCKALEHHCAAGVVPLQLIAGDPEIGLEALEPVELWQDTEEFYGGRICEANENRINALLLTLQSNAFETEPEAFIAVCLALADGDLGDMLDGVVELPQVDEMWWALREVTLARGSAPEFSQDVLSVMEKIVADEDQGDDRSEVDHHLVASRLGRMQDELNALGAPQALTGSINRHLGLA